MKDSLVRRIVRWYKRPNKGCIADLLESLIVIIPVVFLIKTFIFGLYQVPTCSMENTMLVGERFFADKLTPFFKAPQRGEIISFDQPMYNYSKNTIINYYERYVSLNVQNWTKRVIGIPGDHIQGKIEDDKPVVYLNGEKLDEPYLNQYPIISVLREHAGSEPVLRTYDPSKSYEDQPFYWITPVEVYRGSRGVEGGKLILYPHTPAYGAGGKTIDEYDVVLGENQYWMMGDNRQGSWDSRGWGPLDGQLFHGRILFRIWSHDGDQSWWIIDLLTHPINFWKRMRWNRFFQMVK